VGATYRASLPKRFEQEAQHLVNLSGPLADVLAQMEAAGQPPRTR